jgi:maleate isomerase
LSAGADVTRVKLGVLTPSSNTVLEPLIAAMLTGTGITAHFSRFRVVDVGLHAVAQFDNTPILEAARLLAHARVNAIVWSGTSGGWLGVDADRALCAAIEFETGVPATTSTLALIAAAGSTPLGLITPYPDDMHAAVVGNLAAEGVNIAASRNHAVTLDNWELAKISADTLTRLVSELVAEGVPAVCTFCTNLAAGDQAAKWEADFGISVLDSVNLSVWRVLALAGEDPAQVTGWGSLFSYPGLQASP